MNLPVLTNSRLKVARACQRQHRIQYVEGYRPAVEADALRFGTLLHLGLGAWWLAVGEERLAAALAAVAVEADPFDRVRAEELLRGYHYRWSEAATALETLAVEAEFSAPVTNPATGRPSRTWRLGGKLDAIARDLATGRVLLVEHKSSSEDVSPGSDYWRRLRMDGQISIYFDGARSLGHDVEACIYDVVHKPTIRPAKATAPDARKYTKAGALYANQREADETPEEFRVRLVESIAENPGAYYQRGEVVRLERELADARFDVWQTARQIREAALAGVAPRNPDACVRFGRTCAYFSVCCGEASLDDPERFRRAERANEELSLSPASQPKEEAAE